MENIAKISVDGKYTVFSFRDQRIKFRTSTKLKKYLRVKKWDNGYLVVMAKYATRPTEEEEYIDLIPILENLYMNAEAFLRPIQQVEVRYA